MKEGGNHVLFPTLKGQVYERASMNAWAESWLRRQYKGQIPRPNPLLNPKVCQKMVDYYHRLLGIDYSYGGYLEDRPTLWRDSYLAKDKRFTHLGVDFNVPAGTPVAMCLSVQVVLVDNDIPEVGGWGTRVMAKVAHDDVVLIFAHLGREVSCKVGDVLRRGDVFAHVGAPDCNGGWYSHLHVQALSIERYREFKQNPDGLDGYAPSSEHNLAQRYPNPLSWVWVR